MRSLRRWVVPLVLLCAALAIAWIPARVLYWKIRGTPELTPPPSVVLLSDFHSWMRHPTQYVVGEISGIRFVCARVSFRVSERMASGPTVYVFDETGKLVDWVADEGESPTFAAMWPLQSFQRIVPFEEAVRWLAETSSN